jgi:hypothetical protein
MKRFLLTSVFVLASVPSFSSGQSVRQEVEALYKIWIDCMASGKNLQAAIDTLDASYYQVDANGVVTNRANSVAMMKGMNSSMRNAKGKITIERISESKGEICAWVKFVGKGEMKQGNKWVPFQFNTSVVESLKRTPSGLKFIYSQHLP